MQERTLVPATGLLVALVTMSWVGSLVWADARMASSEASASGSEAQAPADSETESTPEPDYDWLTDDNGKTYRLEEMQKGVEGRDWRWIEEDQRIQLRFGVQVDVASHDEESFTLKIYKRAKPAPPPSAEELQQRREKRQRQEEQLLADIAETYRADLETVDRLKLVSFDRGLPTRGQWRNGFDIADMNGDGHQDIVFGAPRKSYPAKPHIYLGDSGGKWRLWREARYPSLPFDYGDAAVDDFNGDGHMDLALGIHLKGILVMVSNGAGRFTPWSRGIGFEIPGQGGDASTFSSRALETADWNGDGKPDLLALGEGPKGIARVIAGEGDLKAANGPIFFINQGDGSWRPEGLPSKVFGDNLAMGDFNGDQRLDFVTASNSPNHTIINLGQSEADWEPLWLAAARPRAYLRAVASGNLNGDDVDDLVLGYLSHEQGVWRSGVDVFYGSKDLEWQRQTLYAVEGKHGIYGVATGDLDADDRTDVVVTTGEGEVLVFLADGEGFFAREDSPELPEASRGCRGYGLRLTDLDGNGRDDLVVSFAGEKVGGVGFGAAPGCADGGSLRAWVSADSPAPVEAASPEASAR